MKQSRFSADVSFRNDVYVEDGYIMRGSVCTFKVNNNEYEGRGVDNHIAAQNAMAAVLRALDNKK